jgi:hypothetical protein
LVKPFKQHEKNRNLKIWNLKICDLIPFALEYEDIPEARSSEMMWLECEANHAPPSAAKVNALSLTSASLSTCRSCSLQLHLSAYKMLSYGSAVIPDLEIDAAMLELVIGIKKYKVAPLVL